MIILNKYALTNGPAELQQVIDKAKSANAEIVLPAGVDSIIDMTVELVVSGKEVFYLGSEKTFTQWISERSVQ